MITVKDLLLLDYMEEAKLLAGHDGIGRIIKWAHVIDHNESGHFLEGGELLLTCGQIWPSDVQKQRQILETFLAHRVSGIVFAVGRYMKNCPQTVLDFGQQYAIPIIEIPFHLSFVRLTKQLHQLILESHFKKIRQLERLDLSVIKKYERVESIKELLDIASQQLKCPLLLTDKRNEIIEESFPTLNQPYNLAQMRTFLTNKIQGPEEPFERFGKISNYLDHTYFSLQLGSLPTVYGLSVRSGAIYYGTIWIYDMQNHGIQAKLPLINYIITLIIDHFIYQQESEIVMRHERELLFQLLLEGHELLPAILDNSLKKLNLEAPNWALIYLPYTTYSDRYTEIVCREKCRDWLLNQTSFQGFTVLKDSHLYIILNFSEDDNLISLAKDLQNTLFHVNDYPLFISKLYTDFSSLRVAYEEVMILSTFIPDNHNDLNLYFANNYQKEILLYGAFDSDRANILRQNILPQELTSHNDGILLETLKQLIQNHYNRELTAQNLHIHRNTLRYRISKIEELLGDSLNSLLCQFWLKIAFDIEQVASATIVHELQNESIS